MYKKRLSSLLLTTAILTSGCAGFKANKLPEVSANDIQFTTSDRTKVFSRWSIETTSSSISEQAKVMGAAAHKKNFEDAIIHSDCCILVEGPTEADVIVEGKAYAENNSAALIPAFITGLSLYTIPSWVTSNIDISVEAKVGEVTQSYQLQDSVTLVQWLPMLLAFPFADHPINSEKEVGENTYNNLVLQMKNDGVLNKI